MSESEFDLTENFDTSQIEQSAIAEADKGHLASVSGTGDANASADRHYHGSSSSSCSSSTAASSSACGCSGAESNLLDVINTILAVLLVLVIVMCAYNMKNARAAWDEVWVEARRLRRSG